MAMDVIGLDRELDAIARHLGRTPDQPHVMVVAGERGMGETTRCRAAAHRLRERGATVLSSVPAPAESVVPSRSALKRVAQVVDA